MVFIEQRRQGTQLGFIGLVQAGGGSQGVWDERQKKGSVTEINAATGITTATATMAAHSRASPAVRAVNRTGPSERTIQSARS
jgi:hypothetical protein